eukprot:PITA_32165
MSSFQALYGYDALTFAYMNFGDSRAKDWIQKCQDILRALKDNLQTAQNKQKLYAKRGKVERHFEVGDLVFLSLQPYKQSTLKQRGAEELKTHFYGALQDHQILVATELPTLDDKGYLVLVPKAILETRERKLRNRVIEEFLVRCKALPNEDSTWEGEQILQHPTLQLLEDKQHLGGEDCDVPSN